MRNITETAIDIDGNVSRECLWRRKGLLDFDFGSDQDRLQKSPPLRFLSIYCIWVYGRGIRRGAPGRDLTNLPMSHVTYMHAITSISVSELPGIPPALQ